MLRKLAIAAFLLVTPVAHADTDRPWATRDSMLVRSIDAPAACEASYNPTADAHYPATPIVVSPDGRYFATVYLQPDLSSDNLVSTLRVYETREVLAALSGNYAAQPLRELTRSNAMDTNAAPICGLDWSPDGALLRYLSPAQPSGARQEDSALNLPYSPNLKIEVLVIATGHSLVLNPGRNVAGPPFGSASDTVAAWTRTAALFRAQDVRWPQSRRSEDYPFTAVTYPEIAGRVAGGTPNPVSVETPVALFAGGQQRAFPIQNVAAAAFAPEGRRLLIADRQHFFLLNMRDTHQVELAQVVSSPFVLWSPDGAGAVLVGAGVPLRSQNLQGAPLLYYDARTAALQPIGVLPGVAGPVEARWIDADTIEASAIREFDNYRTQAFRRTSQGWAPVTAQQLSSWQRVSDDALEQGESVAFQFISGLRVALIEDATTPQRLVARSGSSSIELVSSNPALNRVAIAPSRDVRWTGADGAELQGVLVLPQRNQGPAPLVLQWEIVTRSSLFRPDGALPIGYAAQALAARGIAVLRLRAPSAQRFPPANSSAQALREWMQSARNIDNKPAELEFGVSDADRAIDAVRAITPIDVTRIGALGFSRNGLPVNYIATHPGRYPLRAGIAFDSQSFSFSVDNLLSPATGNTRFTNISNGQSFWQNRDLWLRHSPELNADRSSSALLFVTHGGRQPGIDTAFQNIMQLGAYRAVRRPVDAIDFPLAQHALTRPLETVASMDLTVDWMSFWLQSVEDPNPLKADQYTRWRQLRTDWERQQAWEAAGHSVGSTPAADFQSSQAAR